MRVGRRAQAPEGNQRDIPRHLAALGLRPGAGRQLVELAYRYQLTRLRDEPGALRAAPDRRERLDAAVDALRAAFESATDAASAAGGVPVDPYQVLCVDAGADDGLIAVAYRHGLRLALANADEERLAALEWAYGRVGTASARAACQQPARRRLRARSTFSIPGVFRRGRRQSAHPTGRADDEAGALTRPWRRWLRRLVARPGAARRRRDWPPRPATQRPIPVVARPVYALRISGAPGDERTVRLRDGTTYLIGTSRRCHIALAPASDDAVGPVAPEHARLVVGTSGASFRHLAPGTESFVNGRPAAWALLEPGDQLTIGPYRCRYEVAAYEVDRWRAESWP